VHNIVFENTEYQITIKAKMLGGYTYSCSEMKGGKTFCVMRSHLDLIEIGPNNDCLNLPRPKTPIFNFGRSPSSSRSNSRRSSKSNITPPKPGQSLTGVPSPKKSPVPSNETTPIQLGRSILGGGRSPNKSPIPMGGTDRVGMGVLHTDQLVENDR